MSEEENHHIWVWPLIVAGLILFWLAVCLGLEPLRNFIVHTLQALFNF